MGLTAGQYVVATDGTHVDTDNVKRYVALLTQADDTAPVPTVLENTLGGTVVWTRDSSGNYTGTLAAAFPAGKTAVFITGPPGTIPVSYVVTMRRVDNNSVSVQVTYQDASDSDAGGADSKLNETAVEIRVYP